MTRNASSRLRTLVSCSFLFALVCLLAGCSTGRLPYATTKNDPTSTSGLDDQSELLRSGDVLKISFRGPTQPIPEVVDRIPESGIITLPHNVSVTAVGKTRVELQEIIRTNYVPRVYQQLTVTIAPEERYFYVTGEVQKPDRHPYRGKLTVRDAIAAAGDFREFADKKEITVTRTDGTVLRVHYPKAVTNPALYDIRILPGDKLHVPRRYY